jgi:hypothetical protein
MLFYAEKNHCLYACQSAWNDESPVMRIPVGAAGHVDGEQYPTNYTPRKMHILASRAEMIDLNREINVMGIKYRLDMDNLRIKHLAQSAKSTATTSGKAQKGITSWQTFQKFDLLGDLAYSWYELIGQSPDWRKIQNEPYKAPRDINAGNGWTCPDCGAMNDADSGECDCGTTYDGPAGEESGETLEGEILPPEDETTALTVLPALPADISGHVERVLDYERTAQEAMATFAENVVRCGFELLLLKKKVGHGKWLKFFEQNLARKGFQERHAQNYMQVATAVRAKLGGSEAAATLLLGGEDGTEPPADHQFEVIRDTLADMTDARSWNQLMMDFGLLRSPVQRGGDHGGGAASHERSKTRHQLELELAVDEWRQIIKHFRDFAIARNRSQLVPGPMLEEGMKSIKDCMRQVEQVIQKG